MPVYGGHLSPATASGTSYAPLSPPSFASLSRWPGALAAAAAPSGFTSSPCDHCGGTGMVLRPCSEAGPGAAPGVLAARQLPPAPASTAVAPAPRDPARKRQRKKQASLVLGAVHVEPTWQLLRRLQLLTRKKSEKSKRALMTTNPSHMSSLRRRWHYLLRERCDGESEGPRLSRRNAKRYAHLRPLLCRTPGLIASTVGCGQKTRSCCSGRTTRPGGGAAVCCCGLAQSAATGGQAPGALPGLSED
jgi:hypothetical protein